MSAANFSIDVLEMFYGSIKDEQRLPNPINPNVIGEFEIARNNFDDWMRVWKMKAKKNNKDLFKFFKKTKNNFIKVCDKEVEVLKSVKVKFRLNVAFHINRDGKKEEMNHYFNRMQPVILNEHNKDIIKPLLNQFIDQVKGEIEAWSERGSGWVMDKITEAYINVARYQPMRGGSYMPLPTKLKNKKAIINVQNRDNQCSRWAIRAALFPAQRGAKVTRTSSYPTEDGLNFAGIDFPTPVSQFDRLERQNPNLAINVFGWEGGNVVVYRISVMDGRIPRINLMMTTQGENTHYSYVKRLSALFFDQSKNSNSKYFCERCLHGYTTAALLERHKPECKGLLKSPTRTEMPKEGENKMKFQNYNKQTKAPYVVYADFECLVKKIATCEPNNKHSFTVKTEKHEPCGFSYMIVRSDGHTHGPFNYRGEHAVYVFLIWLLEHEEKNARRHGKHKAPYNAERRLAKTQERNRMPYLQEKLDQRTVFRFDGGLNGKWKVLWPKPQKMLP